MLGLRSPHSLARRMRDAQLTLVILMLVPALLALSLMLLHSQRYHRAISHVDAITALNPIIHEELLDSTMDIVTGRHRFEEGHQYPILDRAQRQLDQLVDSGGASRMELTVSRRILDTLRSYVDRLGQSATVDEQFQVQDEISQVAGLFLDMLENAVNVEIKAAALTSRQMQTSIRGALAVALGLLAISLAVAVITQRRMSRAIRVPISQLEDFALRIAQGQLSDRIPEDQVLELRSLAKSLNTMAYRLDQLMAQSRREQENLKKSELRTLQAQITPHFLYNTLDAIVWLAKNGQASQVIEITNALSDFFRISLNNGKDWVSLREEWEHLTGYLTIQKIRYRDILRYELTLDEEIAGHKVPKLLIQPLVENAIYHGIKNRRAGGLVRVSARREGERLRVCVTDSGQGMDAARLQQVRAVLHNQEDALGQAGYGLYSVDQRIKLYYAQEEGLVISSRPGEGTSVCFDVPLRDEGRGGHVQGVSGG